jgi:predicted nuclease of predicted toxin-antitoxin system
VIERAEEESRLILTFDKDFGELIFRLGRVASHGVILFRFPAPSAEYVVKAAIAALDSRTDWEGHFSVVEDDRIRMTPIPLD